MSGGKRGIPNDEAPLIDVDLWLHEARQANDDGAVQWFTRNVMHTNPPPQTANKRARHHDTLLAQATQHLTNLENLTMRHLRLVDNMYNRTHLYEQTMHHIRNLRDMYDSAITAKRKYHTLQASLAQDHLRKLRTEHQYLPHCTDVIHTYEVAKQTARQLYEDGFNYLRLTGRYTIHIQYYHQLQETHHRHLQWFYRHTGQNRNYTQQKHCPYADNYTSRASDQGKSGTPHCGKSHYSHYPNGTNHTGTQQNGSYHSWTQTNTTRQHITRQRNRTS